MRSPSKFPSSAYFGAALLVVFFFLTCFQAQGQVSSEPKDTLSISKKEKVKYVPYPIYIDASLEIGFGWVGVNANTGVYLNHKHAIGLSFFGGGPISLGDQKGVACLGLHYSGYAINGKTENLILYYKLEAGRVIHYSWAPDAIIIESKQNDLKHSQPYYGRITAGIRFWRLNFYAALGNTGKLKTNYIDYYGQPQTHSFNFTYFSFGLGLTQPMHKSKKTSYSQ
jgi:hypothetical protein